MPNRVAQVKIVQISVSGSFLLLNLHPLEPLRRWLRNLDISTPSRAHQVAALIPGQCPFEREITLWGRAILRIPPLCKLNPVYDELIELRFRALCYLAEECGEDISAYT
ncbi:MAG: Mo-dependent nitrogenase C-terminal domain-containing protein [Nodosilinea sp.]